MLILIDVKLSTFLNNGINILILNAHFWGFLQLEKREYGLQIEEKITNIYGPVKSVWSRLN